MPETGVMEDEPSLPATPAFAQFLANRTLETIATRSHARQRWSRNRIASYITGSNDIEGELSATTLGRFLDADHRQRASPETLRALRGFLLYFRYITPRQLEWVDASLSIRTGLSLAAFYGISETRAQQAFLRELEGEYRAEQDNPPYVLQSRLHLNYLEESGLLTATEVLNLASSSSAGGISHPAGRTDRAINESRVAQFTATGQALGSADLIGIFLHGGEDGLHSILNVRALIYDDDDEMVIGLKAARNAGWRALKRKELDVQPVMNSATPARQAIKRLANDPQYNRYDPAKNIAPVSPDARPSSHGSKGFFDIRAERGTVPPRQNVTNDWDEASTPDDKLIVAWQHQDLGLFEQALALGGNPNIDPTGRGTTSLAHAIAAQGSFEWMQTLLADPRCRFITDWQGLPPSFHLGTMIRGLAGAKGADDLLDEWSKTYHLLVSQEQAQGCFMTLPDLGDGPP